MPRHTQPQTLYRVHLHALVPCTRVLTHGRLLRCGNGASHARVSVVTCVVTPTRIVPARARQAERAFTWCTRRCFMCAHESVRLPCALFAVGVQDMWGVGCVIFETLALFPLFPGANEADQIERIHKVLGTPHGETLEKMKKYGSTHVDWNFTQYPTRAEAIVKLLPQASAEAVDIVQRLLTYDPEKRLSAKDAIKHAWFAEAREMEARAKELAAKTSVAEGGDSSTSMS
ncbi:hypothetical protein EON66_10490, partial [archaeon]